MYVYTYILYIYIYIYILVTQHVDPFQCHTFDVCAQRPLAQTKTIELIKFHKVPAGQNAVVMRPFLSNAICFWNPCNTCARLISYCNVRAIIVAHSRLMVPRRMLLSSCN